MYTLNYAAIIHHSNSGSVFGKDSTTFSRILGISGPSNPTKHTQIMFEPTTLQVHIVNTCGTGTRDSVDMNDMLNEWVPKAKHSC